MELVHESEDRYYVIRFIDKPFQSIDEYVCVPHCWIISRSNKELLVAYPTDNPSQIKERVERKENVSSLWKIYSATWKYDTDSFDDADTWIATMHDDALNKNESSAKVNKCEQFMPWRLIPIMDTKTHLHHGCKRLVPSDPEENITQISSALLKKPRKSIENSFCAISKTQDQKLLVEKDKSANVIPNNLNRSLIYSTEISLSQENNLIHKQRKLEQIHKKCTEKHSPDLKEQSSSPSKDPRKTMKSLPHLKPKPLNSRIIVKPAESVNTIPNNSTRSINSPEKQTAIYTEHSTHKHGTLEIVHKKWTEVRGENNKNCAENNKILSISPLKCSLDTKDKLSSLSSALKNPRKFQKNLPHTISNPLDPRLFARTDNFSGSLKSLTVKQSTIHENNFISKEPIQENKRCTEVSGVQEKTCSDTHQRQLITSLKSSPVLKDMPSLSPVPLENLQTSTENTSDIVERLYPRLLASIDKSTNVTSNDNSESFKSSTKNKFTNKQPIREILHKKSTKVIKVEPKPCFEQNKKNLVKVLRNLRKSTEEKFVNQKSNSNKPSDTENQASQIPLRSLVKNYFLGTQQDSKGLSNPDNNFLIKRPYLQGNVKNTPPVEYKSLHFKDTSIQKNSLPQGSQIFSEKPTKISFSDKQPDHNSLIQSTKDNVPSVKTDSSNACLPGSTNRPSAEQICSYFECLAHQISMYSQEKQLSPVCNTSDIQPGTHKILVEKSSKAISFDQRPDQILQKTKSKTPPSGTNVSNKCLQQDTQTIQINLGDCSKVVSDGTNTPAKKFLNSKNLSYQFVHSEDQQLPQLRNSQYLQQSTSKTAQRNLGSNTPETSSLRINSNISPVLEKLANLENQACQPAKLSQAHQKIQNNTIPRREFSLQRCPNPKVINNIPYTVLANLKRYLPSESHTLSNPSLQNQSIQKTFGERIPGRYFINVPQSQGLTNSLSSMNGPNIEHLYQLPPVCRTGYIMQQNPYKQQMLAGSWNETFSQNYAPYAAQNSYLDNYSVMSSHFPERLPMNQLPQGFVDHIQLHPQAKTLPEGRNPGGYYKY